MFTQKLAGTLPAGHYLTAQTVCLHEAVLYSLLGTIWCYEHSICIVYSHDLPGDPTVCRRKTNHQLQHLNQSWIWASLKDLVGRVSMVIKYTVYLGHSDPICIVYLHDCRGGLTACRRLTHNRLRHLNRSWIWAFLKDLVHGVSMVIKSTTCLGHSDPICIVYSHDFQGGLTACRRNTHHRVRHLNQSWIWASLKDLVGGVSMTPLLAICPETSCHSLTWNPTYSHIDSTLQTISQLWIKLQTEIRCLLDTLILVISFYIVWIHSFPGDVTPYVH